MGLIDTHTHLESFLRSGALDRTLSRAREAGLEAIITIGTAPDDWTLYRDLARESSDFVYYSVGLHPCSVEARWEEDLSQIAGFWSPVDPAQPRPVALGEIGLDRFHLPKNDLPRAEKVFGWQRAAFKEGLSIAKTLSCPVVIHSRGAFRECVEMIDESGVRWDRVVFHCFVEGEAEMEELARRGGRGSFTGILTYKNAENVRAAARRQGFDRFMLETDAPYLTPEPQRGKPNEPAFMKLTAEYAASTVFGKDYAELVATSTRTAKDFFGLRS